MSSRVLSSLTRREARAVLRQGVEAAVGAHGWGRAGEALAKLNWREEVGRRLASCADETAPEGLVAAGLALQVDSPVLLLRKAVLDARGRLLESAASSGSGLAELAAWARDQAQTVPVSLAGGAVSELLAAGRHDEAQALLRETEPVREELAADWLARGQLTELDLVVEGRSMAARARLQGAMLAACGPPYTTGGAVLEEEALKGLVRGLTVALGDDTAGLAAALLVVGRGQELPPGPTGRALLRVGQPEAVAAVLACVGPPGPDERGWGALANALARAGRPQDAETALLRADVRGAACWRATARQLRTQPRQLLALLSRLDDRGTQLDAWLLAERLRALLALGAPTADIEDVLASYRSPSLSAHVAVIAGYSNLDRPDDALAAAERLVAHPILGASETAFSVLRSLCRAHGLERHWPAFRAWCVSHGVSSGDAATQAWRSGDVVAESKGRLAFPK